MVLRTVAHILHLSAADDYSDKLLEGLEDNNVWAGGSIDLRCMIGLRLGGWV